MISWLKDKGVRREGNDFELRLLVALVMTLVVIGAFQFTVSSRQTRQHLLDEASLRAQSDLVFVQQTFDTDLSPAARNRTINSRLAAIAQRDGVRYVLLVDSYGVVVATSEPDWIGKFHGSPQLRDVLSTNQTGVSLIKEANSDYYRYQVPVDLPTGRFALEVEQNANIIRAQVDDARKSALFISGSGIVVGALMFFVFGGRSLSRIHRTALKMSSKDGLTGLENHRTFKEALQQTSSVSARQNLALSLAVIDVDDFKLVNDRLGHRQGDELIKQVSSLLVTGRIGDRVFRTGGDEFAIILPATDRDGAWVVCERLWNSIVAQLDGVTLSVGVATLESGMDDADLHDHADLALYEAKRRGRNNIVSFEELKGNAVIPKEKVRAVRQLLEDQQLGTAFQPIWDMEGTRPLGFEALARPLPEYGLNGPAELFEIGEMIGRTQQLDALSWRWALERAEELPEDILLFMNVSPFTADHGDGPVDTLMQVVAESNRHPSRIVVEFTERWSGRRDLVIEQAERLRAAGFQLALDDVGAGSGDLEMMARLPVNFIKIDLDVVKSALHDKTKRGVFFAIAAFAAHSGSAVIAEGIEDDETLSFIQNASNDGIAQVIVKGGQGYLLGRPHEGAPMIGPAPYCPITSRQDTLS